MGAKKVDHSAIRVEGMAESRVGGRGEPCEERKERGWGERAGV